MKVGDVLSVVNEDKSLRKALRDSVFPTELFDSGHDTGLNKSIPRGTEI